MVVGGYTYILANKYNTVIYIGSTIDLRNRIYQHRTKFYPKSFSAKYNVQKLVHFEFHPHIREARGREVQLKSWNRNRKVKLIETHNPEWKDLYDDL